MDKQEEMKNMKYYAPSISLLKKNACGEINEELLKTTAMMIQHTLSSFGIGVQITAINVGTRFTRFEIVPEMGTRVRDIVRRENEIKITTCATDIHIEAPIPGKAAIGIDIANRESSIITLREIIESKEFMEFSSNLTCAIGKDIIGNIVIADMTNMPHLLIGGTTGSGKTVFINSVIMSILYKANPNYVKMIMIDTKGISLNIYNGIPHLLTPVVTNPRKSLDVLRRVISEIGDRYKKFSDYKVRDIQEFNNLPIIHCTIPQILIIIDDLSDLMALYKSEAEQLIVRIAQISRAAGIHLVIATQRPSTDVITGLLKASVPSRIAFSVFSAIDSRVILDEKGAEKLLGNGDMLFKPQGYMKPIRIQGTYVSDEEISAVVDYLRNQTIGNKFNSDVENKFEGKIEETNSNVLYDIYFEDAGRLVIQHDKASIGILQRVFKIGFNRAARIMDELYEAGVVGEELGIKPRKVLMSEEEFESLCLDIKQKESNEKIKFI